MADIHRTVIMVTVLTDGPLSENTAADSSDLDDLAHISTLAADGDAVVEVELQCDEVLSVATLEIVLGDMGADSDFFDPPAPQTKSFETVTPCPTLYCCYPLGHEERSGLPCRHHETGERLS